MMNNIRVALEDQVIGQMILDNTATFRVQLLVADELQQLIDIGAIVSYNSIQVARDNVDPTALNVRFSYLPTFPLNHIAISFSIDSSSGVTFNTSTASTVQGI